MHRRLYVASLPTLLTLLPLLPLLPSLTVLPLLPLLTLLTLLATHLQEEYADDYMLRGMSGAELELLMVQAFQVRPPCRHCCVCVCYYTMHTLAGVARSTSLPGSKRSLSYCYMKILLHQEFTHRQRWSRRNQLRWVRWYRELRHRRRSRRLKN